MSSIVQKYQDHGTYEKTEQVSQTRRHERGLVLRKEKRVKRETSEIQIQSRVYLIDGTNVNLLVLINITQVLCNLVTLGEGYEAGFLSLHSAHVFGQVTLCCGSVFSAL